jgi:hypothetical protein
MAIVLKRMLAAILGVAFVIAQPVAAQWAWRDASGKMVYSDQPPPVSVPARNIVRQPRDGAASATSAAGTPQGAGVADAKSQSAAAQAPPRPATPTVVEREIESRRRQQQLAEAEKKAADEEARQAKVAENCERMRGYLRALEGGFRLSRVNAAGQQEILDDAARAAERDRTRAEIEQSCP